jgi:hypothetical protein
MSLSRVTRTLMLTATMLAIPATCLPAALSINGSCEMGSCSSPTLLSVGGDESGTFSFVYTLLDTDKYLVTGTYAASFPGTTNISFHTDVAFLGNSTDTTSHADNLTIDYLSGYDFTGDGSGTYFANSTLWLPPGANAGSFTTGELFYNDMSTGLMGPYFGETHMNFSTSRDLTLSGPLEADYRFAYSLTGGATPVPEPAEFGSLVLGFCIIGIPAVYRIRRVRAVLNLNLTLDGQSSLSLLT